MRKGFLLFEEMRKYFLIYMRRPLVIYDFALLIYEENFILFFISVPSYLLVLLMLMLMQKLVLMFMLPLLLLLLLNLCHWQWMI